MTRRAIDAEAALVDLASEGKHRMAVRLARQLLAERGPAYSCAVFRAAAAGNLGALVPDAEQAVQTTSHTEVAFAAAYALGRLYARRSVPILIKTLQSRRSARVRAVAAEALGEIGDVRAERALREALSDRSAEVRLFAAFSLGNLGTEGSLAELSRVGKTDSAVVRNHGTVAAEARRAQRRVRNRLRGGICQRG